MMTSRRGPRFLGRAAATACSVGAVMMLVVGTAGAVPASHRAPGRDAPSVAGAGTYTEFSSNGGSGVLTLEGDDTFTTSYGDSGQWLSIGTTMAMVVNDSSDGDTGCLYLGTLKKKGINAK